MKRFQEQLQAFYEARTEKDPFREALWSRFVQQELPRLKKLDAETFSFPQAASPYSKEQIQQRVFPECLNGYLVFINGEYFPEYSVIPPSIIALPLSEASKRYRSFLDLRASKHLKEEKESFALLNGVFHQEGVFVYVPPDVILEAPLQIIQLTSAPTPTLFFPRMHFFIGKGACAKISLLQEGAGKVCSNHWADLFLEERAQLQVTAFEKGFEEGWNLNAWRYTLKKESLLKSVLMTTGGLESRSNYRISLEGVHSEASLNGLWKLNQSNQCQIHVFMEHSSPTCTSLQKFKGILDDKSRSHFSGEIFVHPEAQETQLSLR